MDGFGDYEQHDALGLAHLIRAGEVTAHEVLREAIARIERRNPPLNAVITTTFERAQRRIADGTGDGMFAGAPFLLKGLNQALEGVPLADGSRSLRTWVPSYTSTLVQRYEAAGLVILGATNVPEFGLVPVTEPDLHGVCANPWDPSRTAGGSSGGSAVAVAAGMVPAASASDGGGSIRIPASQCGVFGLKPTRARTPSGPVHAEGWFGMSVSHALTRSVRDSAALLDVTQGPEPGDPYAAPAPDRPFLEEVGTDPGRLRIGMIDGGIFHDDIHAECRAAVADAGRLLGDLGHEVVPVTLPIDRATIIEAFLTIVAASTAATIAEIAALKRQRAPDPAEYELGTWITGLIGRKLTGAQVVAAHTYLRSVGRITAAAMGAHDIAVIMTSTLATPPLPHHALDPSPAEQRLLAALRRAPVRPALMALFRQLSDLVLAPIPNSPLFNITGQPAMSVPLHWTADDLPIGVQFAGRFGDEATLFRLAAQLEAARPWFHHRPRSLSPHPV
jgi:amidase